MKFVDTPDIEAAEVNEPGVAGAEGDFGTTELERTEFLPSVCILDTLAGLITTVEV